MNAIAGVFALLLSAEDKQAMPDGGEQPTPAAPRRLLSQTGES